MLKIAALVAFCAALAACPHPMPTGVTDPVDHAVDCTKHAIGNQAIGLIPAVNTCLVGLLTANPTACLLALINPARNILEDDVACVVRKQGSEFAAAASVNGSDDVSAHGAAAATQFLTERQIRFSD